MQLRRAVRTLHLWAEVMGYAYYNPNPEGHSTGDCVVRALTKALGQSWDETYTGLCLEGFCCKDWGCADAVWGPYLYRHGFRRHLIPDDGLGRYTVADFALDHPEGVFVLSMPERHAVAVVNGTVFDSWDSQNERPSYFWVKEH